MLHQDIKYDARFNADSMQILATDFYLEPLAQLVCVGTSRTKQTGDSLSIAAGGGYAAMGGGSKACLNLLSFYCYIGELLRFLKNGIWFLLLKILQLN